MRKINLLIFNLIIISCTFGQVRPSVKNNELNERIQQQANLMGQAFLKGDYHVFANYTYHVIVSSMGGENQMALTLENIATNMKAQGMTFNSIYFDSPTKIVKCNNLLQCTLQQHTAIKLNNGRAVATSTLIAVSEDGGKNWQFIDTSNKDRETIRKALPFLSSTIVIPPQSKPIFYKE
jgi:hypothetical protein